MSPTKAVVVGASMTGLMAASVLSDVVDDVLLVERDELPNGPYPRGGVPQGRHVHGLLVSGERVLGQLFPGLLKELLAGGAVRTGPDRLRWWQYGGYRVAGRAPEVTFCSRPFLEDTIRRRVGKLPCIRMVNAGATGLELEDGHVAGVLLDRGGHSYVVQADLVIDATGRSSQSAGWLRAHNYLAPPMEQVHVDIGYTTRLFRRTSGRVPDATTYIIIGDPRVTKHSGFAFPIEQDRWIVTLAGCHGERAPTDEAGFLAYSETLPTDDIAGILRDEESLGPFVTHRLPSSQWRHFERLNSPLPGYLAMGDAICSFNPIYGQGMSSAALQAAALRDCLAQVDLRSERLPRVFYRAASEIIAKAWAIAAVGDFAHPETTGHRPPLAKYANLYARWACVAAQHDQVVASSLMQIGNLLVEPRSLMMPNTTLRILRGAFKGPTRGAAP